MQKSFKNSLLIKPSIVLLWNISIFLVSYAFNLERPFFLYEYAIIILLLAFPINRILIAFAFLLIIFIDLITIILAVYFLTIKDILYYIRFAKYYNINIFQLVVILGVITFISLSLYLIAKSKYNNKDSPILKNISIYLFTFFILLDIANGTSLISRPFGFGLLMNKNISGSNLSTAYHLTIDALNNKSDSLIAITSPSPTFKFFKKDSTGNQLLVIIESFGRIKNEKEFSIFKKYLTPLIERNGWAVKWGEVNFEGSTTSAEIRELLNSYGKYQVLNSKEKFQKQSSIFEIKKKQGYSTIGVHSFSEKMFNREEWWTNIGITRRIFKEEILKRNPEIELNHETSFFALNDEDAFNYFQSQLKPVKTFGYFLTSNSHLPFNYNGKSRYIKENLIFPDLFKNESSNVKYQLIRISEIIQYISKIENSFFWNYILFVGDHAPPFLNPNDRNIYLQDKVPFILLTKPNN